LQWSAKVTVIFTCPGDAHCRTITQPCLGVCSGPPVRTWRTTVGRLETGHVGDQPSRSWFVMATCTTLRIAS
jgi:hypothetical protein